MALHLKTRRRWLVKWATHRVKLAAEVEWGKARLRELRAGRRVPRSSVQPAAVSRLHLEQVQQTSLRARESYVFQASMRKQRGYCVGVCVTII